MKDLIHKALKGLYLYRTYGIKFLYRRIKIYVRTKEQNIKCKHLIDYKRPSFPQRLSDFSISLLTAFSIFVVEIWISLGSNGCGGWFPCFFIFLVVGRRSTFASAFSLWGLAIRPLCSLGPWGSCQEHSPLQASELHFDFADEGNGL